MFATLLPLGVLQLYASVKTATCGTPAGVHDQHSNSSRVDADARRSFFIVGGTLPFLWISWLGLRYPVGHHVMDEPQDVLFIEKQPTPAGSPTPP